MLRFIILGLLSSKSMTGYDLKTFFKRSINFFWSAELSQIYRELSKLEKDGYISYKIEHQKGRPNKKIYSITGEGEEIFNEWLKGFPKKLTTVSRNEFLVRVFFSSKISDEELIFQLKRYIREQEEELKIYRGVEKRMKAQMEEGNYEREVFHKKFTVRRGIYFAQSEIAWANECIEEIKKLES